MFRKNVHEIGCGQSKIFNLVFNRFIHCVNSVARACAMPVASPIAG